MSGNDIVVKGSPTWIIKGSLFFWFVLNNNYDGTVSIFSRGWAVWIG